MVKCLNCGREVERYEYKTVEWHLEKVIMKNGQIVYSAEYGEHFCEHSPQLVITDMRNRPHEIGISLYQGEALE